MGWEYIRGGPDTVLKFQEEVFHLSSEGSGGGGECLGRGNCTGSSPEVGMGIVVRFKNWN